MSVMLPINEVVESVSITHKFDKPVLKFLNTSDVENGKIINVNHLPIEELKGQAKKTIKKHDILFSEIRPKNRRFAYVDFDDTYDFVVSTKLMVLRKFNPNVDNKYFYYFLTNDHMLSILQDRAENRIGSFPQITFDLLSEYSIRVPHISEQQKIASVLSALDSKIEINNRINAELEAMAKTIYDYWFVQFDFPDKNGKPYKSSGGKMVWNEELKREIPEGWHVKSIEDCCKIIGCLHSKKPDTNFESEKYYLLQLENLLDNGLIDVSNKYYVSRDEYSKWTSRIEVKEHDILITNAGRVAATTQVPEEILTGIGRNITAIRPISISPTYLFLSFRGIDIVKQIKSNTDSGAFFSSFNVKGIKRLNFLIPSHKIESDFEKVVYPIRRKREINLMESQQLASLRDWLLPMLMNGQVKVN